MDKKTVVIQDLTALFTTLTGYNIDGGFGELDDIVGLLTAEAAGISVFNFMENYEFELGRDNQVEYWLKESWNGNLG